MNYLISWTCNFTIFGVLIFTELFASARLASIFSKNFCIPLLYFLKSKGLQRYNLFLIQQTFFKKNIKNLFFREMGRFETTELPCLQEFSAIF
jgi:hypothetical protein